MTYTFKLSKRLAQCYAAPHLAAARSACAADRAVAGAFPPDTHTTQLRPIVSVTISTVLSYGTLGRRVPGSAA